MSSFRKKRGKTDTTPVEVPRSGLVLRDLPEPTPQYTGETPELDPAPAHQPAPYHDPAAPIQRNPMQRVVLGPGNLYTRNADGEESLLGTTTGLTIEPAEDAASFDVRQAVTEEIARRAADDLERSFMAGESTRYQELSRAGFPEDYQSICRRINLQACHDWGSYVSRIEGHIARQHERMGIELFGSARAYEMTTSMIEGFEGNMHFRSAPGTYSPAMSAVVAAHHHAVREGLGQLVQSLEAVHRVTAWRFAFIFCPDGFPALCGIVNTSYPGGDNGMVIGGNMRNGHHYQPVEREHRQAIGDAVADFLFDAHVSANPALRQFFQRGRR